MKKTVIASIFGVVASFIAVAPSYGQGQVNFSNYLPANGVNAPVTFADSGYVGSGITAGEGVGSEFYAVLLYSVDSGSTWLTATTPSPIPFYGTDGDSANGAGYFGIGTIATLDSWTSGAVDCIVQAYSGSSYGEQGYWSGQSTTFSVPSASIGTTSGNPPGYLTALTPFNVSFVPVPEPATMALAGLGGLSLLLFRRRKS